jgi:uncharacterized protein (TIGR03435 family)
MRRFAWLFIASAALCVLHGQNFEVASVRLIDQRSASDRIPHIQSDSRRIDYHYIRIDQLVRRAWPLQPRQIVWPESMASQADRLLAVYDVSATMPEGTSKEQQRLMLRNLLADRLHLKAHIEMRDTKVYALEVSPGGLKLRKAKNPPADGDWMGFQMEVAKGQYWKIYSENRRAPEEPSGVTIFSLINAIQQMFDRPLVDQTGLDGFYDLELNVPLNPLPEGVHADPGDNSTLTPSLSAVSGAVEKQLGIKVTPETLPYETLVIEQLDRNPGEN